MRWKDWGLEVEVLGFLVKVQLDQEQGQAKEQGRDREECLEDPVEVHLVALEVEQVVLPAQKAQEQDLKDEQVVVAQEQAVQVVQAAVVVLVPDICLPVVQ